MNIKKDVKMASTVCYTGMNGTTNAEIEYKVGSFGGFYLHTKLELKGRGIKFLSDGTNHKRNLSSYRVTENAMNKLKENYNCCYMASL